MAQAMAKGGKSTAKFGFKSAKKAAAKGVQASQTAMSEAKDVTGTFKEHGLNQGATQVVGTNVKRLKESKVAGKGTKFMGKAAKFASSLSVEWQSGGAPPPDEAALRARLIALGPDPTKKDLASAFSSAELKLLMTMELMSPTEPTNISPISLEEAPLPPGWVKLESSKYPGHFFYRNADTGGTVWERPGVPAAGMTGLTAELVGHLEAMTADIAAPPPRDAMAAINGACASFLAGELGLVLRWLLERLGVESTLVKHKSLVTLQMLAENQAGLKFALAGSEEGKAKVRSLLEYEVADDPVMGGKPKLMVRDAVRTPSFGPAPSTWKLSCGRRRGQAATLLQTLEHADLLHSSMNLVGGAGGTLAHGLVHGDETAKAGARLLATGGKLTASIGLKSAKMAAAKGMQATQAGMQAGMQVSQVALNEAKHGMVAPPPPPSKPSTSGAILELCCMCADSQPKRFAGCVGGGSQPCPRLEPTLRLSGAVY
jgi:hypothetical protein